MKCIGTSRILIIVGLLSISPQLVRAHDGWVEISPTLVQKDQLATISLIQGNHSNEHKSYRIAGKWDAKNTVLSVIEPKGNSNNLTDRLIDMGEDAENIGPKGPKGFHLASFVPKDEGLYLALARQARTVQQGDGPRVMTVRIAKSAFAAFKSPTVSAAKNLKGFDRLIGGEDGAEFIPLQNPLAVFANGTMALELRHKGRPIAGQAVSMLRRIDGFASVQERTSDDKGHVRFVIGPADFYLVRVKIDEESARPDSLKDKASYESTYVFQVFNRP